MQRTTAQLKGFTIRAADGDLGTVDDFYFDDETWTIRYLTVETGGWLGGRPVLISPISIIYADWQSKRLDVALTKKQVENSPNIDTHKPVSRQHEVAYVGYYGYPYYWAGPYEPMEGLAASGESEDTHLRSTQAVSGYYIEATDGEIGHVKGFVVDDETWTIRYMEVTTQNWWPGKKVLVAPAWIQQVSWAQSKVFVQLTRQSIQTAPEYIESKPVTREYENLLYSHYGLPPYWLQTNKHESSLALSSL
jgi:hypothetical protein